MAKVKIEKRGNRHIIGKSLLYLVFNGCDYDVYDDGEYEGTYVGSIDTLKTMTENEAVDYIFGGL